MIRLAAVTPEERAAASRSAVGVSLGVAALVALAGPSVGLGPRTAAVATGAGIALLSVALMRR